MITIRCRAIIIDQGELLVVKNVGGKDFVCLPGGKLEHGENPLECIKREVIEELGIAPRVGKLLYVNSYQDTDNTQSVEFFFEVINGSDYRKICLDNCSHAYELEEITWIKPTDDFVLLPKKLSDDFINNDLSAETYFI